MTSDSSDSPDAGAAAALDDLWLLSIEDSGDGLLASRALPAWTTWRWPSLPVGNTLTSKREQRRRQIQPVRRLPCRPHPGRRGTLSKRLMVEVRIIK